MIKEKKNLIKRRKNNPEFDQSINSRIDEIDQKIMSRVNGNDQNLLRVFFRTCKEMLDPHVFARIEDVASTRHHQYINSRPRSHK